MQYDDFSSESIGSTAFFTGHRILSKTDIPEIQKRIYHCITSAYLSGYRRFFCGCALGFDTIAAFQTVRLRECYPDVRLALAIPCKTQSDRWKSSEKEIYQHILDMADEKIVLSPVYYQGAMLTRNRYMADRSSLCICWLKEMHGGTASAVRYALLQDRIRVINLAVREENPTDLMRETSWNCMFISRFARKNAVTVPLRLIQGRKLFFKHI
jgi:uncharacterized phage-like protein YoqJ